MERGIPHEFRPKLSTQEINERLERMSELKQAVDDQKLDLEEKGLSESELKIVRQELLDQGLSQNQIDAALEKLFEEKISED